MATIAQNLAALQQARADIAEAIENKGVTLAQGTGFTDFPQAIDSIPTGVDTSNDTVTPETLAKDVTAHDASGALIVGTGEIVPPKVVYGISINNDESDPYNSVTYLEGAVGMTPAKMGSSTFDYGSWENAFFMPKPCMLKYDGTVAYYLDPNDYTKKLDGTPSDVANPDFEGNAMMEFPLIYYKFEFGGVGKGNIYISNYQVNDDFKCYSNYDCNGDIIPHFYMAIYNGTGTSKLRSLSGVLANSTNGCGNTYSYEEKTRATANNTKSGKEEWFTDVWCDRVLITVLLYLIGKSLDLQGTFGQGLSNVAAGSYRTGAGDTKGLFYGDVSGEATVVKVFGIENFWGYVSRRTNGLVAYYKKEFKYKMTYSKKDGSTGDGYTDSTKYISQTYGMNTDGRVAYISECVFGNWGLLPRSLYGSSSTYYCDYCYFYPNGGSQITACVGGCYNDGTKCGFYIAFNTSNDKSIGVGAALSCKPCLL